MCYARIAEYWELDKAMLLKLQEVSIRQQKRLLLEDTSCAVARHDPAQILVANMVRTLVAPEGEIG